MSCRTLENETPNETSLFIVPPNFRAVKINARLRSRICSLNISKLEEFSTLYDARDTQLFKNLLFSADLLALRTLKMKRKNQACKIADENSWSTMRTYGKWSLIFFEKQNFSKF